MSSTVTTYQTLQTEGLVTINFSLLSENFKIIDNFIKAFPAFQRKITDLEKQQKATAQDLSNFKLSTQNTFSTINDVIQTRSGAAKGSSLADSDEMKLIKKQIKQIKGFMTETARQQQHHNQTATKQSTAIKQTFEGKISQLKKDIQQKQSRIINLEQQCRTLRVQCVNKIQLQQSNNKLKHNILQLEKSSQKMADVQQMLANLNVQSMRQDIDQFDKQVKAELQQMKSKLKLKADYSDVMKLQEMLLNLINYSHEYSNKKLADKAETKKALIFLQKKMNRLIQSIYGQEQGDALVTTKGLKCISCTKDLGQFEGKLDKYKAWSVFPAKDPQIKDRYSGFGAGFQTIVETTVTKKGGEVAFDDKGRMTAPYNLTREVQGSLLKPSGSQSKLGLNKDKDNSMQKYQSVSKVSSPTKGTQIQTNYMINYGKNSDKQRDIDLKQYYLQKQRGLMAHVKYIIQNAKNDKKN